MPLLYKLQSRSKAMYKYFLYLSVLLQFCQMWLHKLNDNYLKTWLLKNPISHNDQILEYYQKIAIRYCKSRYFCMFYDCNV